MTCAIADLITKSGIEWEEYRLSRMRSLLFAQKSTHRTTLQVIVEFVLKCADSTQWFYCIDVMLGVLRWRRGSYRQSVRTKVSATHLRAFRSGCALTLDAGVDAYAKSFGAPCTIRKKGDGAADAAALFAFFMSNYNFLFLVREDTTLTYGVIIDRYFIHTYGFIIDR